ncbi:MAG TPA: NYN domain-containing protein [Candidatus Paceibacterota bacterium]|nr:NYN domain-containing protein [Candidatus Paceibacterota bacterium]
MSNKITVPQRKTHRIGVFVDVQNMYHSAKNLYKARVNFGELLKIATSGRELVRAVAYVVKSDTPEEKAFFDALEKAGYELKSKDLQIFPGGMKKGDWDVGLAVDAISLSKQLDVVIIVSGDGDFEPLVEYLKFSGLIVETVSFRHSTSTRLIDAADNFIDLGEANKILLKAPRKNYNK